MATTKKALAMAQRLTLELGIRQSALAAVQSVDTDENPLVRLGAVAAGDPGALFKVMPITWTAKDILGNASTVFTPHVVQVCFEAPTAGAGADVDPNTWAEKLLILGVAVNLGARVEVFERASGTAPVSTDLITANLKATFEASAQYGMSQSQ